MQNKYSTKRVRAAGFLKRNLYYLMAGAVIFITALTLILVFTLPGAAPVNVVPPPSGEDEIPAGVDPVTFIIPVENGSLSKSYTDSTLVWNPTLLWYETHQAVDFTAEDGANVFAAYDGTVESVGTSKLYGTVVTIAHKDNIKTVYKSLASTVNVKAGDAVKTGDTIGTVSNSQKDEKAQGIHLHFETMVGKDLVDPLNYFADLGDK